MSKRISNENRILIMLAFFSVSLGLWGNFRQLWLQNNGLEVGKISNILSLGTFLCVIGIIIFSKKIKVNSLKTFISTALVLKAINLVGLFVIDNSNIMIFIRIFVMLDIILEKLIIISIYPLIVTIKKDDNFYSKRKLTEYLFRDLGLLIGGILIGKVIAGVVVNYNICLLISVVFLVFAFIFSNRNKSKRAN